MTKQPYYLPVVETFYSIQGEGEHSGKAAFFIRLGGCDVCCTWCDEKKSWDDSIYPKYEINDIVMSAIGSKAKAVVITGGEPFRHNMTELTKLFKQNNFYTSVETSGTEPLTGIWDWITLSPKKNSPPLEKFYKIANELKVVIQNKEDFLWAEKNQELANPNCVKYLQPEWSNFNNIIQEIIHYIKSNQQWRLSVQTHKFLNIP